MARRAPHRYPLAATAKLPINRPGGRHVKSRGKARLSLGGGFVVIEKHLAKACHDLAVIPVAFNVLGASPQPRRFLQEENLTKSCGTVKMEVRPRFTVATLLTRAGIDGRARLASTTHKRKK